MTLFTDERRIAIELQPGLTLEVIIQAEFSGPVVPKPRPLLDLVLPVPLGDLVEGDLSLGEVRINAGLIRG